MFLKLLAVLKSPQTYFKSKIPYGICYQTKRRKTAMPLRCAKFSKTPFIGIVKHETPVGNIIATFNPKFPLSYERKRKNSLAALLAISFFELLKLPMDQISADRFGNFSFVLLEKAVSSLKKHWWLIFHRLRQWTKKI